MSEKHVLSISETRLLLDNKPFYLQGLSFFNALYNEPFNAEPAKWLDTFLINGCNTLRIWSQWEFDPARRPFVDCTPDSTLFTSKGELRPDTWERLERVLAAADSRAMVVELTLFAKEKGPLQPVDFLLNGTRSATVAIKPFRNVILQLWNEHTRADRELFDIAKKIDPDRIVTSSVGGASAMGSDEQNAMYDLLTPHTARSDTACYWEEAPRQISMLLEKFRKPVIDDEPARCGLKEHGGIPEGTRVEDHITQIREVRRLGGYHVYHHDMFQRPRGNAATPDSGIPDPDFNPFHRAVFDYLKGHTRW